MTEGEDSTQVVFEQFPSFVGDGNVPVMIASSQTLIFFEMDAAMVRQLMLDDSSYYTMLTGDTDPTGFSLVNDVLTCIRS